MALEALTELLERLDTPASGRRIVDAAVAHAPVRQVQGRSRNVTVTFNSIKMDRVLEVESNRVEFPRTVELEHDDEVVAYFPQPYSLDVTLHHPRLGRNVRFQHTPDFLTVRRHRLVFEEWKEESQLFKLAETQPHRYVQTPEGGWTCPALIKHCEPLGIQYELHTSADLPRRFVENVLFLRDYHDADCPALDVSIAEQLTQAMKAEPVRHLHDLIHVQGFRSDDIFKAVVDGILVADLDGERLADTRRVRLFRDIPSMQIHQLAGRNVAPSFQPGSQLVLKPGVRLSYEGALWDVALVGQRKVVLEQGTSALEMSVTSLEKLHRDGAIAAVAGTGDNPDEALAQSVSGLAHLSARDVEETVRRLNILAEGQESGQGKSVSARTLRRWRAQRDAALAAGGNEALAVAPKTRQRGNRLPKLPAAVLEIAELSVKTEFLTHKAPNITACYQGVKLACADAGLTPPSLKTYTAHTKRIPEDEKAYKRQGPRAAYQKRAFYWRLAYDTPAHGVRPWENIHIDHTQLDLEVRSSVTDEPLGRPWATFATDAYSRRIVGIYLTFDSPSYRAVLMAIRDMVRRFGRIGTNLVLDRGSEFRSGYMLHMLKLLGCDRKLRPGANPRMGSTCERMFGTANTTFVHNLVGNTKITKHVRTATKSVMPQNLAEWTLETLYFALEHWATELYDTKKHPTLGMTPREAYERGMTNTGVREHRLWRYDRDFLILTCPTPARKGETRKIELQRGIRVNEDYYWSPLFSNPLLVGTTVDVRYDPWDVRYAFVRIGDKWEVCRSKRYGLLDDYNDIELRTALEELKRLPAGSGLKDMKPETIREWLKIRDPRNFESVLAERQAATRKIYGALAMYSVSHFESLTRGTSTENIGVLPTFDEMSMVSETSPVPPGSATTASCATAEGNAGDSGNAETAGTTGNAGSERLGTTPAAKATAATTEDNFALATEEIYGLL